MSKIWKRNTRIHNWKESDRRKPILLDGARQVGKTYLVEQIFGQNHFSKVHKLDFLANPKLSALFDDGLDPSVLLNNIEIHLNTSINVDTDLIFFDEIGESQSAVNSLKYFSEQLPQAFICASGSNIGLLDSFPVGKVKILELFPLCFEEFLMASENSKLLEAFRTQSRLKSIHDLLWKAVLDYYFVGGMPEAVANWYNCKDKGMYERTEIVKQIHANLINGYLHDFGKYSGKANAQHIESVFRNVPRQLSRNMDGSVKRFMFKDVIVKKQRYTQLSSPISWLEKTKLVSKCYPISSQPSMPLASLIKENIFKLFFFDRTQAGEIIPIEVKSGTRTRAKSLKFYSERYNPSKTIKLIGSVGGNNEDKTNLVWPLYYAQFLTKV